jgi:hypothetical protein
MRLTELCKVCTAIVSRTEKFWLLASAQLAGQMAFREPEFCTDRQHCRDFLCLPLPSKNQR